MSVPKQSVSCVLNIFALLILATIPCLNPITFLFPSPHILNLPNTWVLHHVIAGAELGREASRRCIRGEKSHSDLAVPVPRSQHMQGRDVASAGNNMDLASQIFMITENRFLKIISFLH